MARKEGFNMVENEVIQNKTSRNLFGDGKDGAYLGYIISPEMVQFIQG